MQHGKIRAQSVWKAFYDIDRLLDKSYDYQVSAEVLREINPEFTKGLDQEYVSGRLVDLLEILTNLYDKGYQNSIKETYELK